MFRHYRVILREFVINTLPIYTNRAPGRAVSQLKICDFSGETFKGFGVL